MTYKYITENNLENRQNYMYSEYKGIDFLRQYIQSRNLENKGTDLSSDGNSVKYFAKELLEWYKEIENIKYNGDLKDKFELLVKSFEVRKRLYREYDEMFVPINQFEYYDYDTYICFQKCLIKIYAKTKDLKYLNCLLKLDDTMISILDKFNIKQKNEVVRGINIEKNYVLKLAESNGICIEDIMYDNR